jgi:hypothetical protein
MWMWVLFTAIAVLVGAFLVLLLTIDKDMDGY